MSPCARRKMMQILETSGKLDILPGRGRKKILFSSVKNMATAVIEGSSYSLHGSVSVSNVFCALDMAYTTV